MKSERLSVDRRTLLGTLGSGAILAVAGCAEDGQPEGDGDGTADETEDGERTEGETEDGVEQLDQPTEFPEGEECAVCNMITSDHPDWNSQLAHEDETRTYFCSSGCMSAYYADPGEFDGPDSPVANVWVTDFESGELFDAEEASFVKITSSDHVDDIMMMNPTPFMDRTDAVSFVEGFDEYTEEDIIELADFDMELAKLYRGKFFEDGEDGDQ